MPEEVAFATKPKIARQRLERAFDVGVPCGWVTGDAVYGNDRSLPWWLQERGQAHVLAVSGQERVTFGWQQQRVKDLLPPVPEDAWQTLCCGAGSQGPRRYDWARLPLNHGQGSAWERWLLVRKSLSDPARAVPRRSGFPRDNLFSFAIYPARIHSVSPFGSKV